MQNFVAGAMAKGFAVADFEIMTIGMVIDVLSEYIPQENRLKIATQEDIDKYL